MTYLMLVLPYVLVDLVGKERRLINAVIDGAVAGDPLHGLPHVEDPCEAIIAALLVFFQVVHVSSPNGACRVGNR